jgi:hypothetical protein
MGGSSRRYRGYDNTHACIHTYSILLVLSPTKRWKVQLQQYESFI